MSDTPIPKRQLGDATLAGQIGAEAARKIAARGSPARPWMGLGMMGVVGWSVSVPTLLGATLGHWVDAKRSAHSWTLSLLVAGLALGCANAWHWVAKEQSAMDGNDEADHE